MLKALCVHVPCYVLVLFFLSVLTSCASPLTIPMKRCTRCCSWPSARAVRVLACSDSHGRSPSHFLNSSGHCPAPLHYSSLMPNLRAMENGAEAPRKQKCQSAMSHGGLPMSEVHYWEHILPLPLSSMVHEMEWSSSLEVTWYLHFTGRYLSGFLKEESS